MSPSSSSSGRGPAALPPAVAGVAAAREALAGSDWSRARELFEALVDTEGAIAWEGVAEATWWLDDGPACLRAREEAYRLHREAGRAREAAVSATALGYDAALFGQGGAVALGWLGRARSLLDAEGHDLPEHGWLAVREAELALQVTHRPEVAVRSATQAVAIGRTVGQSDLELVGQGLLGLVDVTQGRVDAGMERLDAAVAGALVGDVPDVMWVGKVCCWLVAACQRAQDLPRALEWCARVDELCRERDLAPLFTACRIQYASVRLASGHWAEAEQELVAALERMRGSHRATRVDAVVQLGHLRRRQGRPEEAEVLYLQAGFAPQAVVGRALLRLARGDASGAWALARPVLDDVPTADRLARSAVLLPVVRCAVAAGRLEEAAVAAAELRAIAEDAGYAGVRGAAAVASALVADPAEAPTEWRNAARCFHRSGLLVDEAEARVALAGLLSHDEPALAADELRSAVAVLETLEVPERLAATRELLADLEAPPAVPSVLTPREVEVLRLVAGGRSNAEIARSLVVSEHTVHRHVSNILTRLDEPTRGAAAARGVRDGLI